MANLDGSRSHGGKWDILAGAMLRDEPAHFTHIYRVLITAARAEGIGADRLPDFLGLEHDGEFDLLGQDELDPSALENAFKDQIANHDLWEEWNRFRRRALVEILRDWSEENSVILTVRQEQPAPK